MTEMTDWTKITLNRNEGEKPLDFVDKVNKAFDGLQIDWQGDALQIARLEVYPNVLVKTKDGKEINKRLQAAGLYEKTREK